MTTYRERLENIHEHGLFIASFECASRQNMNITRVQYQTFVTFKKLSGVILLYLILLVEITYTTFLHNNNLSNAHSYGSTYCPNSKSYIRNEDLLIDFIVLQVTHVSISTPIVNMKGLMDLVTMFCTIDLDVPIPCTSMET